MISTCAHLFKLLAVRERIVWPRLHQRLNGAVDEGGGELCHVGRETAVGRWWSVAGGAVWHPSQQAGEHVRTHAQPCMHPATHVKRRSEASSRTSVPSPLLLSENSRARRHGSSTELSMLPRTLRRSCTSSCRGEGRGRGQHAHAQQQRGTSHESSRARAQTAGRLHS